MCITATGGWRERSSWGCTLCPWARLYGCVWGGNLGWVVLLWVHLLQVTRGFWPMLCTLLTSDPVALQDCSLLLQRSFVGGKAQTLIIHTYTHTHKSAQLAHWTNGGAGMLPKRYICFVAPASRFKIQETLFIPREIAVQQLWNKGESTK